MAIFFHWLMKNSRMVMKVDPMAFQNVIQGFLCILSLYNNIIIIFDWITIMRYSKHELSKIKMLKNCYITPSLPIKATSPHNSHFLLSPRWPLWRGLTVAFNSCIIMIFNKGTIQDHSILFQLCYFWQYLIKILYFLYHYKLQVECTL